ncbi:hypothetical protein PN498_00925 [Oscillatoria sp. CS-180]|uniref:hypothetical protein n=1 Tax=Oscillatoria sp. CS-180 TaxID=3021720 RepID=UPI00232F6AC9|nr:hypothetical protein [Oscillatoria sp. CS-180]MDB9524536.1 hypothetical protein [Oscillatoria sp. CS-180]
MTSTRLRDRLVRFFELWAFRFAVNLLKFSLAVTLAGTLMFAVAMAYLFTTTGEGSLSAGGRLLQGAMQGFNFVLFSVTGGGDFQGGVPEIGELIMAFAAPYLTAINVVVSIAEALTGKSLFRGWRWTTSFQLKALLTVFGVLVVLSIAASNLPAIELPHWLRILSLSFLGGWAAVVLLLLNAVSLNAERAFRRYRDRVLS